MIADRIRPQDVNLRSGPQMREYVHIADRIAAEELSPILDWGCGWGQVSQLLLERGLQVESFDYRDGADLQTSQPLLVPRADCSRRGLLLPRKLALRPRVPPHAGARRPAAQRLSGRCLQAHEYAPAYAHRTVPGAQRRAHLAPEPVAAAGSARDAGGQEPGTRRHRLTRRRCLDEPLAAASLSLASGADARFDLARTVAEAYHRETTSVRQALAPPLDWRMEVTLVLSGTAQRNGP
jgi:hypothetical protein